jgi:preprotein translocase subunit YajC
LTHLMILAQVDPAAPEAAPAQPAQQPEAVTVQPDRPVEAPANGEGTPPPWWATSPIIPILLGILVLYFFVFRSKKVQDRKRQDMLGQLKKGDRVQTIGGILGTVIEARDTEVLLKVDESSNTKIRFARNAIHRVVEEEAK